MEGTNYQEINELLSNLKIREQDNKNEEEKKEFKETRKNVENVFMRDLNFFQGKNVVSRIETSVLEREETNYEDTNILLNERGFMPTSSVFPGNSQGNINVIREDIPLSTRVISKKKQ